MKKIIIGLIALAVLAGGIFLLSSKGEKASKKSEVKVEDKIYVAVEEAGEIAVISTKNRTVIKRVDLSAEIGGMKISFMPHNIQVSPDNKSVWVTANAVDRNKEKMSFQIIPKARADEGHGEEGGIKINDQIIVIDPLTDKIIKRIEIGTDLHLSHVALTPDSSYAIVAAQTKGVVYKINVKTYEVEKEVITEKGGEPHGLRISPDGKTAYIAMLKGKSIGVLGIEKMTLSYVPIKGAVVQTGVTSDGKYALASVYDTKSLAVYDIASQKLSYVDLPKEAKGPVQIYPTPDSKYVYVADQGYYFNQPNSDLVYKIDLQEMKVSQTIKGGTAPHGVAVSQDGKFVYVTNLLSDDLSMIDTSAGKEVAKIKVGKMPNGVSLFYGDGLVSPMVEKEKGFLMAEETVFDFGTVPMYGGKVKHNFTLKNTDQAPVKISKIYTSCMCTEATLISGKTKKGPFGMPGHNGLTTFANQEIGAGESATIEVEVDPAAHGPQGTGPAKKVVYVETDDSQKLQLMMDINVTR
ncbi:MAG: DUF1573 domain-containing protein [Patescibacteria group bacterium]